MIKIILYFLSTSTAIGSEELFEKLIYAPFFKKRLDKGRTSGRSRRRAHILVKFMEKAFAVKFSDYKGYAIALSHLDAAWKWTVLDSKVRAYKTFYYGLEYIQKYPFYSVSFSSPQYFDWIKKYDKILGRVSKHLTLWEETKKMVAINKIDSVGGMWIEPDLNMPCGEALVRQRLYGQLYYLRNFGKISKVETLLDTFGFCNTLPQILIKSGAESFWTTKITWNDTTLFPFANFMWKGADGSEIFTHMYKFNLFSFVDFGIYKKTARRPNEYGLVFNSHNLMDCENKPMAMVSGNSIRTTDFSGLDELKDKVSDDRVKTLGIFYGLGDGGKGPLELEIQFMENFSHLFGYKHTTTHNYFRILKKDVGDKLVTWDDELYFEWHRGCLTTQVKVKKGNRYSENLTIAAEILSTLSLFNPELSNFKYPKDLFNECWQKIMFNQFHDILTGCSVAEVYPLTWKEHDYVINQMHSLLYNTVSMLHSKILNANEKILIYNPVAVKNETNVSMDNFDIPIGSLEPLSFTILDKNELLKSFNSQKGELKLNESYSVIIIENSKLKLIISKSDGNLKAIQIIGNKKLEKIGNLLYGERNGYTYSKIPSLSDIDNIDSQILKMRGARLRIYHEDFQGEKFPAWNIDQKYKFKEENIIPLEKILINNNKDKISVKTYYKFLNSSVKVEYLLRIGSDKLDLNIDIDLKDPKLLFKYFIPLNIKSEDVVSETPFGSVSRKRVSKTKMEKAKWEFSMQKWLDIGDEDIGIAILNKDRYGASANAKGIGITLVRSPPYTVSQFHTCQKIFEKGEKPEFTDLMHHNFTLAILPHIGTWMNANIPARGLAFNNEAVIVQNSDENNGSLKLDEKYFSTIPAEQFKLNIDSKKLLLPQLETNAENIIISVFKPGEWINKNQTKNLINKEKGFLDLDYYLTEEPSEWFWDKKTVILRVFESNGQKSDAEITLSNAIDINKIKSIEEVDLLEWKKYRDVDFDSISSNSIAIKTEFGPYEIKTLRINLM